VGRDSPRVSGGSRPGAALAPRVRDRRGGVSGGLSRRARGSRGLGLCLNAAWVQHRERRGRGALSGRPACADTSVRDETVPSFPPSFPPRRNGSRPSAGLAGTGSRPRGCAALRGCCAAAARAEGSAALSSPASVQLLGWLFNCGLMRLIVTALRRFRARRVNITAH